ncbi:hypothetical protein EV361DRAFT_1035914 [Lentinula raphanica]|nr:hypothetical protein EV361DRAFT_1035914 [Lentinula raphanica]
MLPEEILHAIVQSLAYNPNIIEREFLDPPRKYCAPALLPLSVTSHQFRRICLPFLFAYVKLKRDGDLRKLQSHSLDNVAFFACIKALDINAFAIGADYQLLPRLLPHLHNLSCLFILETPINTTLLHAIQCHPSATVVISSFNDLPPELDHSDLGKVIVKRLTIYRDDRHRNEYDYLLDCGMKVKWAVVNHPRFLNESFGNSRFSGLIELELKMGWSAVDLSWFDNFSCAHPHLRKISFTNFERTVFQKQNTFMFIVPFLKALAQEDLTAATYIKGFAVTRDTSTTNVSCHWRVTSLFLTVLGSFKRVLSLASSSFPETSVLTIDRAPCTVDELITSFHRFPCLKIVSLLRTFERIDFGSDKPWQDPSIVEVYDGPKIGPVATEFAMNWCTSRIAKAVPSIEAFYIREDGCDGPNHTGTRWHINGWIFVHDMHKEAPSNTPIALYITPLTKRPGWRPGSKLMTPKYFGTTFFV